MAGQDLIVAEEHDLFDLADEAQILAELQGRVTERFIYEFLGQGGRREIGLSYAGTNWALREYARQGEVIRVVGHPDIQPDPTDPDYIIAVVTAQRFAVHPDTGKEIALDSHFGVKRQWKNMEIKVRDANGQETGQTKIVPDKAFVEKAISKAQRNAFQACMPVDFIKQMIATALSRRGKPPEPKANANVVPEREHPAKKMPPPVAPPPSSKEEKIAPPSDSGQDSEHLRLCQRINILAKKIHKDAAVAKKFLCDITMADSVKDLPPHALTEFIAALSEVLNGKYKIVQNDKGNWEIHDAAKGRIFPVFPEPVAPPTSPSSPSPPSPPQPEPSKEEEELF